MKTPMKINVSVKVKKHEYITKEAIDDKSKHDNIQRGLDDKH